MLCFEPLSTLKKKSTKCYKKSHRQRGKKKGEKTGHIGWSWKVDESTWFQTRPFIIPVTSFYTSEYVKHRLKWSSPLSNVNHSCNRHHWDHLTSYWKTSSLFDFFFSSWNSDSGINAADILICPPLLHITWLSASRLRKGRKKKT